jgi:hypothetical protein
MPIIALTGLIGLMDTTADPPSLRNGSMRTASAGSNAIMTSAFPFPLLYLYYSKIFLEKQDGILHKIRKIKGVCFVQN